MQKTLLLILLFFMVLVKLKAQDSVSTFFVNLNVNITKDSYINYVPNAQIGSHVKSVLNVLKPSILIRTKKRNFREFELTTFSFSSTNTYAEGIKLINSRNNSEKDTSLVYEIKNRYAVIQVTHRYNWNFLKKKSKKFGLGLSLANSFGIGFYKIVPLKIYAYNRNTFSVAIAQSFGLFANYQLNNKLIIGVRKDLLWGSIQFTKHRIDNPLITEIQRNQSQFDLNLHILPPGPTILAFNIAYKL